MRFELGVALKYVLPKWRQLSVSLISMIAVGVISLVVWLVLVFLSVADGLEHKWIAQLVATNAHLKIIPTPEYFASYDYLIDGYSLKSGFQYKSLGEKRVSEDPYDPTIDFALPNDFPSPLHDEVGNTRSIVRSCWSILEDLSHTHDFFFDEFEVGYANLQLHLIKEHSQESEERVVNQLSYILSHSPQNYRFAQYVTPVQGADCERLYHKLSSLPSIPEDEHQALLESFFNTIHPNALKTGEAGVELDPSMYPEKASWSCCIIHQDENTLVVVPQYATQTALTEVYNALLMNQFSPVKGILVFEGGKPLIYNPQGRSQSVSSVWLDRNIVFDLLETDQSMGKVHSVIQDIPIEGKLPLCYFSPLDAQPKPSYTTRDAPLWFHLHEELGSTIPFQTPLGHGILVSSSLKKYGAHIGDQGSLHFMTNTSTIPTEQSVPVYLAGFFDGTCMPMANKMIFSHPQLVSLLRSNLIIGDQMANNGFQIWANNLRTVPSLKRLIQQRLEQEHLTPYFTVEDYEDYEFSKPIIQQLKSDKYIFTLVALIILIVACSSIISMLILLVNDKKKEIGILIALGASRKAICLIFGMCGVFTGIVSSLLGIGAAMLTLKHIDRLMHMLSLLYGQELASPLLFGSSIPNTLSHSILSFTILITVILSLLAGLIPSIKAARIKPSDILKIE